MTKPYGDYPVLALEEVPAAGILGRMIDSVRLWFQLEHDAGLLLSRRLSGRRQPVAAMSDES
jgi:hypothetical protein